MSPSAQVIASHSFASAVGTAIRTDTGTPPQPTTRPSHTTSTSSSTGAATPTESPPIPGVSTNNIAVVSIAILIALIVVILVIGSIIYRVRLQKRTKKTKIVEAEHRRWPSVPPVRHGQNHPIASPRRYQYDVEKTAYHQPSSSANRDAKAPISPEKIGIAVSPDIGTMESPESRRSDSSLTKLLPSKATNIPKVPPPALKRLPPRPPSTSTIFEDEVQAQTLNRPHNATPSTASGFQNSSAQPLTMGQQPPRQMKKVPQRLHIPQDYCSPPPIIISPPTDPLKGAIRNPTKGRLAQMSVSDSSSRSTSSSSPPNFAAFPVPPTSNSFTRKPPDAQIPSSLQSGPLRVQNTIPRKATPSYLPDYYTDPTPAPVYMPPQTPIYPVQPGRNAKGPVSSPLANSQMNAASDEILADSHSSTNTSFESIASQEHRASEDESRFTKPLPANPESPLKELSYPKVPRPSNQSIPRSPASNRTLSHSRDVSGESLRNQPATGSPSFHDRRLSHQAATGHQREPVFNPSSNSTYASKTMPRPGGFTDPRDAPPSLRSQNLLHSQNMRTRFRDDSPTLGSNHHLTFI